MRSEFIGVWSETWREIWLPLIEQPLSEIDEGVPSDIFCELYRQLAKALKRPTDASAVALLLGDAIALREAFEAAAQAANQELGLAQVQSAFDQSGVAEGQAADERRTMVEVALSDLLEQPAAALLDAALLNYARDVEKLEIVWGRAIERVINDAKASRETFENTRAQDLTGERALVGFVESVHDLLEEFESPGNDALTNRYFNLLAAFIEKYSLRYDLRRPCTLCPTLPGVFASLVRDLRVLTGQDAHLDALMKEFENAVRDLRHDCSDGRIKTCIQKQVNLLEAIGRTGPGITEGELSGICNQITTWPHGAIKASLKNLYGFACDYPGIRHGGNPAGALRAVDMRDMVAMSVLLAGFTPYLAAQLDADAVYRGG